MALLSSAQRPGEALWGGAVVGHVVSQAMLNELPAIGMGTVCRRNPECLGLATSVVKFLQRGGRHIESAPTYGKGAAHRQIATALRTAGIERGQLWLTSKVPVHSMGYTATLKSLNDTLTELSTPYLDLALVHRANSNHHANSNLVAHAMLGPVTRTSRIGTWRALQDARQLGMVRHTGVSNYGLVYLRELEEAGLPLPQYIELEYHPWVDELQVSLVRYCQSKGIRIIAYNSLGSLGAQHSTPRVAALAKYLKSSEAQVLLLWALEQHVAVIPTSQSAKHMAENLATAAIQSRLDDASRTELALIASDAKPARWASFTQNDPHRAEGLQCDDDAQYLARLHTALDELRRGTHQPVRLASLHDWPTSGVCPASKTPKLAAQLGALMRRASSPFVLLPRYLSNSSMVESLRTKLDAKHQKSNRGGCAINHDGHGDLRCHSCEHWDALCKQLFDDSFLQTIVNSYFATSSKHRGFRPTASRVLGSLVRGVGENSGGGWHQDESASGDKMKVDVGMQVKCMAYLEDIRGRNAPFTMLLGYNRAYMASLRFTDAKARTHRFHEDVITNLTAIGPTSVVELHAPKGSVICFESGSIHHGKPLLTADGGRHAATVYYNSM